MTLYYGQIRPSNYTALRQVYGYEPPWPMERSPHVDLVRAILEGRDPERTAFADYLRLTDRPELLPQRVAVLRDMLEHPRSFSVDTCCDCVLDGNHRTAVSLVVGHPLAENQKTPYQTIKTPERYIPGRRHQNRLPASYDFTGKKVLDLGCDHGMATVEAFRLGAYGAILVDHDLTSDTWRTLGECVPQWRWVVRPMAAAHVPDKAFDETWVVLALSVVQHLGVPTLARLAHGKDVILETHNEHDDPPNTGHTWKHLGNVPYSVAEPNSRFRRVFLGTP